MKLFITHGGFKSYAEAAYHGKPMIVLPVFVDQFHNAAAIQDKGLGIRMEMPSFTPEELVYNIERIITDPVYLDRSKQFATLLRDRPLDAKDRVAFWVNHIIKFGGKHLRSGAVDLSMPQFLMLDVWTFFLLIAIVCILIIYYISCYVLSRFICFRKQKHKNE